jgi:hypothetical protein
MAEEKDIALLADNDIIVEIEVQEAPTVVVESPHTTTAEISGDSAIGFVVGTLPTLAKEKTLADGIASIEGKFENIKVDLTPVAKETTLTRESKSIKDKIDAIPATDLSQVAKETTLTQGISEIKNSVASIDFSTLAKEATLLAKVAELKDALNTIDFTSIEQAIQDVEDVTAREETLSQGVKDIIKAIKNIDFTDLENSIAEVKNAVANIDFSALAKEETLTKVQSKVEEVGNKIDNIKLPEIDTTELAKETTLNAMSSKLDNLNVEVDLTQVAKQGNNADATNSAILEGINSIFDKFDGQYAVQLKDIIGE